MSFLNRCKQVSKHHKDSEQVVKIVHENKLLLSKIMEARDKKMPVPAHSYHLAMYEKRNREI